jgi:membrane protease YdiL (CAAX protease family)
LPARGGTPGRLRLRPASGRELAATLLAFVVGILLFPVVITAAEATALPPMDGFDYTLSDPVTAAIVAGSVVLAPLVEEVLFRGYLLGALRARGPPPPPARSSSCCSARCTSSASGRRASSTPRCGGYSRRCCGCTSTI